MRKRIGLAAIGAILIVVITLFIFGGVKLSDFTTDLAVGLILLCPAILFFMFKPEVDSWVSSRHKQKTSFQSAIPHEYVIPPVVWWDHLRFIKQVELI
jgi:hypothetical protein